MVVVAPVVVARVVLVVVATVIFMHVVLVVVVVVVTVGVLLVVVAVVAAMHEVFVQPVVDVAVLLFGAQRVGKVVSEAHGSRDGADVVLPHRIYTNFNRVDADRHGELGAGLTFLVFVPLSLVYRLCIFDTEKPATRLGSCGAHCPLNLLAGPAPPGPARPRRAIALIRNLSHGAVGMGSDFHSLAYHVEPWDC